MFVVLCALAAITYVAARGGLQMPVAATLPPVAAASQVTGSPTSPPSPVPSLATSAPVQPSAPAATASTVPPSPSAAPATPPIGGPPTHDPSDPRLALPPCAGLPGCFEYVVQRGDTLSGIASSYILPVSTVLALNPELADPGTVVVGSLLYLGRDPMLRLEPCPDSPDCALYVIRPGDGLATIAVRFGLTLEAILDANPSISDVNQIFSGQALRLPRAP